MGAMIPVVLESATTARDATTNEPVRTWVVEAETWAEKRTLSARERFSGDMHVATTDTEWRFRYRTPFDPRWRIREVRTGELHQIDGQPSDPDGGRRWVLVRSSTFRPDAATTLEV